MGKVINGDSYIDKSWFDDYDPLFQKWFFFHAGRINCRNKIRFRYS